jgi:hypothetical protein
MSEQVCNDRATLQRLGKPLGARQILIRDLLLVEGLIRTHAADRAALERRAEKLRRRLAALPQVTHD